MGLFIRILTRTVKYCKYKVFNKLHWKKTAENFLRKHETTELITRILKIYRLKYINSVKINSLPLFKSAQLAKDLSMLAIRGGSIRKVAILITFNHKRNSENTAILPQQFACCCMAFKIIISQCIHAWILFLRDCCVCRVAFIAFKA